MRLSCTFASYSAFFVESDEFQPTPPAFVAPVGGELILFEFRRELWCHKTRVTGLSCGVICVILCLAVLIEYRSDRHTDRHTHTRRHTKTAYTMLNIAVAW